MVKKDDSFRVNGKKFSNNSQIGITLKVLMKNKGKNLTTSQVTTEAAKLYKEKTGNDYAEITGRHVRKLFQDGLIHRTNKGIFVYNGIFTKSKINPFTAQQIKQILKRDNYRCVCCSKSKIDGALLTADHIDPQWSGGQADISNGQTLCAACENMKSNYDVYAFGKKMFSKYLKKAKKNNDKDTEEFILEILKVFQKYNKI
tara:strand:- start:95 stop:697 length:603 start_codon:yes stop_codon:yes gene_type:complete